MNDNNMGVSAHVFAEVMPPPSPVPVSVTLAMPYDVAVSLHTIMRKVSGNEDTSYRGHTNAIRRALDAQGVSFDSGRFGGGLTGKSPTGPS